MPPLSLGRALRIAQGADPAAIPDIVLRIAGEFGATDVVVYLVDFAQTTLEPLPDRSTHTEVPKSEEVATTMAGRAFVDQRATSVQRPEGVRLWVPIVEGSDRTGVLAVTVADADDDIVRACEDLGVFAGYLIATQARATDIYNLHRRRRSLSLAASMQWDLLPPLVLRTERMTVAALIEPAYEVGGDCFDYALNETVLDLGVFDPVGHGMASALIAALNVGAYRHDRRRGQSLEQMHAHLDETMRAQFRDLSFATGQLVRVDMGSGEMTWTNAGHPLPMLLRGGKVIDELRCPSQPAVGAGRARGLRRTHAGCHRGSGTGRQRPLLHRRRRRGPPARTGGVRRRTPRGSGGTTRVGPAGARGDRAPARALGPGVPGRPAHRRRHARSLQMERSTGVSRSGRNPSGT